MAQATKTKASTQQHLDFDDITDDLMIFKTGWVGLVMSVTAVNFDLLSEAEQDATIYAYGAFLNSLTFPIQILIRSKKADITQYFNSLAEAERTQLNPDLQRQIQKYQDFIQSIVQQRTVLDKKFYIIINFSPLEMGFKGLTKKNVGKSKSKMQLISDAKAALFPKRDHIIKQMTRLGLTTRQLSTKELIELFYDIYNPAPTGTQRVILDTASYTVPIVEPAVEIPTPAPVSIPSPSQGQSVQQVSPQIDTGVSSQVLSETVQPTANSPAEGEARQGRQQPISQELRPVPPPPAPEQATSVQTQNQSGEMSFQTQSAGLSSQQQQALSSLQQTAAKAAQAINQRQSTITNKPDGKMQQ